MRKYQSRRESEVISTITAIFALAVALISSALLPVDIFLVSYMKNQNGTFKVCAFEDVNCFFERSSSPVLTMFLLNTWAYQVNKISTSAGAVVSGYQHCKYCAFLCLLLDLDFSVITSCDFL